MRGGVRRLLMAGLPPPGEWAERAACRGMNPETFMPRREDSNETLAAIKRVCERCEVIEDCLAYALPHRNLIGVWGGTTAKERRRLRGRKEEAA